MYIKNIINNIKEKKTNWLKINNKITKSLYNPLSNTKVSYNLGKISPNISIIKYDLQDGDIVFTLTIESGDKYHKELGEAILDYYK
jgi:hypothetical protein